MTSPRNVIIIGSGPAGHTAGIYAARANLKPLMFEGLAKGGIPGGQLMITNDVEKVDLSKRPFTVWQADGNVQHKARTLIIATGAQAKWLGLESEAALQGK